MATIRLVPSTYAVSNTSLSVSNASNMYSNTDSTNYATITQTSNTTSSRYLYLRGFNFSSIPSNATVSSFTVKVKGYESGIATSTSYAPRLSNDTTAISGTTATTTFGTSTKTITIPTGSLTWSDVVGYGANFSIMLNARRANRNTSGSIYCYGAEIEVTYTAGNIAVTGVDIPSTASVDVGDTTTLTATISPSNATNQNVTWSSNNTSVATVSSSGVVTGVSAGTAVITVTTADGGYTDTCTVTVSAVTYTNFVQTNTLEAGKTYLIANGNTGSVYVMSNQSAGSRLLAGVSATITNGKLALKTSQVSNCSFACSLYDSGNDITTVLMNGGSYLYSDNSTGLRLYSASSMNRFWHYNGTKFWLFKSTTTDGYTDTSSEYKYYLSLSSGNFTDNHLTSPSVEDTSIPAMYLFVEDTGATDEMYLKVSGSWVKATAVYKKVNGSWVEQTDLTTVFNANTNYLKEN